MSADVVSIAALQEERELGDTVRRLFDPTMTKSETIEFLSLLAESEKELIRNDPYAWSEADTHPVQRCTVPVLIDEARDQIFFEGDIIPPPSAFTQDMMRAIELGAIKPDESREEEIIKLALTAFDMKTDDDSGESR